MGSNLYKFGRLLDAFWTRFGCLLDTFWMPFGARDVPVGNFGIVENLYDFWSVTGVKGAPPFGPYFGTFDDLLAVCFLSLFWVRHFLTFCSFRFHLGPNLAAFCDAWEPWK